MNKPVSTLSAGRPSSRQTKATTLASLHDVSPATKRMNFELPADEHLKLKIYAARRGKTVREVLAEYVAGLPE